jgi:sulfide:quinone oxidoreductase
MRPRVVVLGAGFGGLELTTILSEAFGDTIDIVLIDKGDAFVFGFSKPEVMFGRQTATQVRHLYRNLVKPGVRFLQTTIRSFDPAAHTVVTDAGNAVGLRISVGLQRLLKNPLLLLFGLAWGFSPMKWRPIK